MAGRGGELTATTLWCRSIHKWADCTDECYVVALIWLDRLQSTTDMRLRSGNVHKARSAQRAARSERR